MYFCGGARCTRTTLKATSSLSRYWVSRQPEALVSETGHCHRTSGWRRQILHNSRVQVTPEHQSALGNPSSGLAPLPLKISGSFCLTDTISLDKQTESIEVLHQPRPVSRATMKTRPRLPELASSLQTPRNGARCPRHGGRT